GGGGRRDIRAACLPGVAVLTYYPPEMQDILVQAAEDAGAEVRRGARVTAVEPSRAPRVIVQHDGREREVQARLVVGADGRGSHVRTWGRFEVRRDPDPRLFPAVLFEHIRPPHDLSS